jgi:hypothetical protein
MPKKPSASPRPVVTDESDPRFLPVIDALGHTPGFSLMESRSRGTRGLMLNGKSFGMSSHGRLILKLNNERVLALIAGGVGEPFRPSADRVMNGWIDVTEPTADWVSLAGEALELAVAEQQRTPPKTKR